MSARKRVMQPSIFLIKDSMTDASQFINADGCHSPVPIQVSTSVAGMLYIRHPAAKPPKWAHLFRDFLDLRSLETSSISAALLLSVDSRFFVLTFGLAGRFLLVEDSYEERFGLICALNCVDRQTFRCVDVQSLDAIQSHSRIQSTQGTTPEQFGLDVEQDMLKAIVGMPLNPTLGTRMTGTDALSVSVPMDLADLPGLLREYKRAFEKEVSDYEWINNITSIKNTDLIATLDDLLANRLRGDDHHGIWLSIPEIIDWNSVSGFMFTSGKRIIHPDVTLEAFLGSLKPGTVIDPALLKRMKVYCADSDHNRVFKQWSIYKCTYAEVDIGALKYVLNGGKWFSVAPKFVTKTNEAFAKLERSTLSLPLYSGGGEGKYNQDVAESDPATYTLLDDRYKVFHGGGKGQVEICDLFHIDKTLIHVKVYGKSSVLSHLFAQGVVSGQLIQVDSEFRQKVLEKLSGAFSSLLNIDRRPQQDEFTVTYAIISRASELHLPFFSRVNLNNTERMLRGFGFKVNILKIGVEDRYAHQTIVPPSRRARRSS